MDESFDIHEISDNGFPVLAMRGEIDLGERRRSCARR